MHTRIRTLCILCDEHIYGQRIDTYRAFQVACSHVCACTTKSCYSNLYSCDKLGVPARYGIHINGLLISNILSTVIMVCLCPKLCLYHYPTDLWW